MANNSPFLIIETGSAKKRIDALREQLTKRISKNALLAIADIVVEDNKQQLLSQGTYGGEKYRSLTDRYTKHKAAELIQFGKLSPLGPSKQINTKGSKNRRVYLKPVKYSGSVLSQIKTGAFPGARILELGETLYNAFTTFPPKIQITDDGFIIKFPIDYPAKLEEQGRKIIVTNLSNQSIREIIFNDIRGRVKNV
jgi:hypothetical protein